MSEEMSKSEFMGKLDEYCNELNYIMSMVRNNEEERTQEKLRQHYYNVFMLLRKIMKMSERFFSDREMMDKFNDVYRTGERAYDDLRSLMR